MALDREKIFNGHMQADWSKKRLDKLVSILGEDWFKGKKVLDVACGHGDHGMFLTKLGAKVTFTDGRPEHVEHLIESGYKAVVMDQDAPWNIEENFHLIVHWGIMYHLNDWRRDVRDACGRAPLICLETEMYDSDDPNFEKKIDESGYDQALNGVGTLVSSKNFENWIETLGYKFTRYDDEDLDLSNNYYSWKEGTIENGFRSGQRRFYMLERQ